jgi:DNA-directed RNA polymerase specialized sigma24 family protein
LVLEVLRKDPKATAEFVNRYGNHVYGYIRRRLIPHTEFMDDLVQEVFLAAWASACQTCAHSDSKRLAEASLNPGARRFKRRNDRIGNLQSSLRALAGTSFFYMI